MTSVLITGAGLTSIVSIIKALKQNDDIKVIAIDSNPLSVGFFFSDKHYTVPKANDENYISELLSICKDENVRLLFSNIDDDLRVLSQNRGLFESIGTKILISSPDVINTCLDKYLTYHFFKNHQIPTPDTFIPEEIPEQLDFPYIIKPRHGRGTRNIFKIADTNQMSLFRDYIKDAIFQKYIEGMEYSVDLLLDEKSKPLRVVSRKRIERLDVSTKGITHRNQQIIDLSIKICERLPIIGPANIQCIETASGGVYFIEVNPRVAGTIALTIKAGANILLDMVRMAEGEQITRDFSFTDDIIMLRFWDELYLTKEQFKNAIQDDNL